MATKATYKFSGTPTNANFQYGSDDFLEFNLQVQVTGVTKVFGGISVERRYRCTVLNDFYNLTTFKENNSKISKPTDKKEGDTDGFSKPLIIKNPKMIGFFNSDTIIRIEMISTDGKKVFEYFDYPLFILASYRSLDDFAVTLNPVASNFVLPFITDDTKQFNLSITGFTKNLYQYFKAPTNGPIANLQITDDTANLFSFSNGTKQIEVFVDNTYTSADKKTKLDILTPLIIKNPKTDGFSKDVNLVYKLFVQGANDTRDLVYETIFPISMSTQYADVPIVPVQIDNSINIKYLSATSISFSSVHEFRRPYNFDFSITGIALTPSNKVKIEIFDDTDNLFSVFVNDTKTFITDAETQISITSYITNPTKIGYNKNCYVKISLLETVETVDVVKAMSAIPIQIATTYSTVKRAIFDGTRDIEISNLKLEPYVVGNTVPNEVFINTDLFKPIVSLSPNLELIFDDAKVENKTTLIKMTITGLGIGTVQMDIAKTDNLLFFENGLKTITYDVDTNLEISELSIPLICSNPFKLGYSADIELMYTISDLIDEYSNTFNFKVTTTYAIANLEAYIVDKISSFSTQMKKGVEALTGTISAAISNIELLTADQFATLNTSVQNFDSADMIQKLKLDTQFSAIEETIKILDFVETNIQEIPSDVKKEDIKLTIFNILEQTESEIQSADFDLSGDALVLNTQFSKGRYILRIDQKSSDQLNNRVVNSTLIGNYTLFNITTPLQTDVSNFKVVYQGIEYLIVGNTSTSILILGSISITDADIAIVDNLFDSMYFLLTIMNYDIDDVGSYFLNKRVKDLKTKEESYYELDNRTVLYKLRFITDANNQETRSKE